ncbi:MAG TPA: TAXI family TRAP transporter solute-binding subunit [Nitrospirota bacterium]|nr:TAXI family TRAP transporter solute-binding subunit [Nitrospirota bacterium]
MQKTINVLLLIALAALMTTNKLSFAQAKDIVILGTATPGGGFPVYGEVFAEAVNQGDPTLLVQNRNTKGSTDNITLLNAGQLDIALVQGEVVHDVFSDTNHPPMNLKIIIAMYSTPGMFVVRGDSPYHSIEDLKGKPVIFGARGSGLVILARYVLDGLGLDQKRDFHAVYLDRAGDGPVMVNDGRAAALWGGGLGWPGFEAVAKSPHGARFIAPDKEQIIKIIAKHPFLKQLTIPAGSYTGQSNPISSVGSWSFVLARPTLPDDIAYRVVRALHRSEHMMAARLPQARETTISNTLAAVPRQDFIHSGVLKYLRECGLIH